MLSVFWRIFIVVYCSTLIMLKLHVFNSSSINCIIEHSFVYVDMWKEIQKTRVGVPSVRVWNAKPTPFLWLDQRATIGVAFRSRRDAPAILKSPPPSFVVASASPIRFRLSADALEFHSVVPSTPYPFIYILTPSTRFYLQIVSFSIIHHRICT